MRSSSALLALFAIVALASCSGQQAQQQQASQQGSQQNVHVDAVALPAVDAASLRPLSAFAAITDDDARAQALFLEVTRVMLHPRCANCHPQGDTPLQGMQMLTHDPPVARGADDHGEVGMRCQGCHQETNLDHARVPGAPKWHVAAKSMAWVGRTPHEICEQLKDKKRNGGKSLAELVEHNTNDALVAWGWNPGHGREKAPGDQKQFGALFKAWVDAGAACPSQQTTAQTTAQRETR